MTVLHSSCCLLQFSYELREDDQPSEDPERQGIKMTEIKRNPVVGIASILGRKGAALGCDMDRGSTGGNGHRPGIFRFKGVTARQGWQRQGTGKISIPTFDL
jgi:hypothetical protein